MSQSSLISRMLLLPMLLAATLQLSLVFAADIPFEPCAHATNASNATVADQRLRVLNISADPWPIQKGKELKMSIIGDVKGAPIESGFYSTSVAKEGTELFNKEGHVKDLGVNLPLKEGRNVFNQTVAVPSFLPQGFHQIKYNQNQPSTTTLALDNTFKV